MKLMVYNEAGLIGCVLGLMIGLLLVYWYLRGSGQYDGTKAPEHIDDVWRGDTWRDHDAE